MKFLNGWKTAIGAAGLIVGTFAPKLTPVIEQIAGPAIDVGVNVSGALAALGIIHKLVKAFTGKGAS